MSSIDAANLQSVYYAGASGLKLGKSGGKGALGFNLSAAGHVTATTIVVSAKQYNSSKAANISVNGATAQSLGADFQDYTFTINSDIDKIVLNSNNYCWVKSVTVNYTVSSAPSISASDVTLESDATSGEIAYTIANPVEGKSLTATTDAEWISNLAVGAGKVTFSTTANAGAERTADVTLKYEGATDKVVKVTQKKPMPVYESLAALVNAGKPTEAGETVKVTLTNEVITGIDISGQYRNGIYLKSGDQEVEIYCWNVPEEWIVGGTVSGTLTCTWKLYNTTWELCPASWDDLTYKISSAELTSVVISGTPSKTAYVEGEEFDPAGLIVTANFDNGDKFDVTSSVTWTVTPSGALTLDVTKVNVKATYSEMTSDGVDVNVTVAPKPKCVTWDLSKDETAYASEKTMRWTSDYVTMTNSKFESSTAANNYYGGDSNKRTSTRFYKDQLLSIDPVSPYMITSIVFEATTAAYATTLQKSTWTNASASVDGTTVTVTPVDEYQAVQAHVGGTCGFTSVTVNYAIPKPHDVTITSAGYATAYVPFAATVEGATAYYVTVSGSTATLNKIEGTIPANTGVILEGEEGTATLKASANTPESVDGNLLKGTVKEGGEDFDDLGFTYYILSDGEYGVGFYWDGEDYDEFEGMGAHCDQYKAILAVPETVGAPNFFSLDGEATAIQNVEDAQMKNAAAFNLAGQVVNRDYKGIVIMNGKKFLNK
ncbi:MAG: bacterial Ig-like domain-containing protein [Prevotellaceae bacterium]|nr:bacterial Ig-like domain-containing protein [Candidatus Colivivens caballi]